MTTGDQTAARRQAIRAKIESLDLRLFPAWSEMAELSGDTVIDLVEIFDDEIIWDGEKFSILVNVYVTLSYPDDEMSDVFPATIEGHMKSGSVMIDRVTFDTSSFYYSHGIKRAQ